MTTAPDLAEVYRDLHQHPELGFTETRTAGIIAERLRGLGFEVTTGLGSTGVLGVLANGDGPKVMMRADMDALPVKETTGLPYASTDTGPGVDGQEVPLMHACGHDMHVTGLLGACESLAADRDSWSGTLLAVFQPAEELIRGAQAMIDDGLFDLCGTPDVVLAQHIVPMPAGLISLRAGASWAASDSLVITLHGRGAHGSQPQSSIDPVVMAAATVMRLQGIVSRELAATETGVVTVGSLQAGSKDNIIPATAELKLSVRTLEPAARERILAAIRRIVKAEAAASGAPQEPEFETIGTVPVVDNDSAAVEVVRPALEGVGQVVDIGPQMGAEDAGELATASGAPMVYWLVGCADPALFEGATSPADILQRVVTLPVNHSPDFAPVIEPTLTICVQAMSAAARAWLSD